MSVGNELRKIAAEARRDLKPGEHVCKYCGKGFVRETTLAAHLCEPKRRVNQKSEKGVMIGFQTWLRFYELTQGSAQTKTYDDFSNNQFYNAFVKFGRHCVSINAIKVNQFIDYILKNQFKVDHWCREKLYEDYLFNLLRTESYEDALERGVSLMQEWAEDHSAELSNYFRSIGNGTLVNHIVNGRISPWVLYCCDSGIEKLDTFNDEHVAMTIRYIEPDFWLKKIRDYSADAAIVRYALEQSGF
jgi:hypothetical protein